MKGQASRLLPWLDGQDLAPVEELIDYLGSDDPFLRKCALKALGAIGRREAFKPLVRFARRAEPGSEDMRAAVAALSDLTCMDFGLDPALPMEAQPRAVNP